MQLITLPKNINTKHDIIRGRIDKYIIIMKYFKLLSVTELSITKKAN